MKIVCRSFWVSVLWPRRFRPREALWQWTWAALDTSITKGCSVHSLPWSPGQHWGPKGAVFLSPVSLWGKTERWLLRQSQRLPISRGQSVLQTQVLNSTQPHHWCRRKIQAFLNGVQGLCLSHSHTVPPSSRNAHLRMPWLTFQTICQHSGFVSGTGLPSPVSEPPLVPQRAVQSLSQDKNVLTQGRFLLISSAILRCDFPDTKTMA